MMALQEHPANERGDLAFSPDRWLARYIELGGGYTVVGDAIWLHWSLKGDVNEGAIKAHERIVRRSPEHHAAVKALIMDSVSREVVE